MQPQQKTFIQLNYFSCPSKKIQSTKSLKSSTHNTPIDNHIYMNIHLKIYIYIHLTWPYLSPNLNCTPYIPLLHLPDPSCTFLGTLFHRSMGANETSNHLLWRKRPKLERFVRHFWKMRWKQEWHIQNNQFESKYTATSCKQNIWYCFDKRVRIFVMY